MYQGTTSVAYLSTPREVSQGTPNQVAGELEPEGGGGFNPRIKPSKSARALAPEKRFSEISPEVLSFSATCLAPEGIHPPIAILFQTVPAL
jgi:hypothetical protein